MWRKSGFLSFSPLTARYDTQRYIVTTCFMTSKSAAKYARRFLVGSKEKKRVWHEGKMMANPIALGQPQTKGEGNSHRLQVLNKVFMENISDIMATGKVSEHLEGRGLEITKVRVLPGMSGINVYWISSDTSPDISNILQMHTKGIRHELSQLRILGRVPHITFVKDQRFYKSAEVETRLSLADFGTDFEPTDATHHLKSSLTIKALFSEELMSAVREMETKTEDSKPSNILQSAELPSDLPSMRGDVLGVDTDKIFAMVQKGITRAEASHRNQKSKIITSKESVDRLGDIASRTEEIRRWASQYRDMKKRERRSQNKEQAVLSVPKKYVMGEIEEIDYFEDKDYLEEDFLVDK